MAVQELINRTIQTWQPYYEQPLSEQDGAEIIGNWSAYISLLSGWASSLQKRNEAQS